MFVDLKLKDAAKVLGKKFASGASINESEQTKAKEIVIQGDVSQELPFFLSSEFNVWINRIISLYIVL